MCQQLRQLFVVSCRVDICVYCNPTDPLHMFETNVYHLMKDFVRNGHEPEVARNLTLKSVQDKLNLNHQTMEELSLPVPDFEFINRIVEAQIGEDGEDVRQENRLMGEMMLARLNEG